MTSAELGEAMFTEQVGSTDAKPSVAKRGKCTLCAVLNVIVKPIGRGVVAVANDITADCLKITKAVVADLNRCLNG